MDSIAYINELINYATCNMTTFELNIESDTTIKHNIFDGTTQTQEFVDFIWDLYFNYSEDEEQMLAFLDQFQGLGDQERCGSYTELFKEFQELCKTRKK
jgi:hypothetical protein